LTATLTPINIVTQNSTLGVLITSDLTPAPGDVPTLVSVPEQPASAREIIRVDASRISVTIS
jgi:hypothetical protein